MLSLAAAAWAPLCTNSQKASPSPPWAISAIFRRGPPAAAAASEASSVPPTAEQPDSSRQATTVRAATRVKTGEGGEVFMRVRHLAVRPSRRNEREYGRRRG